jgi:hypothetical protein
MAASETDSLMLRRRHVRPQKLEWHGENKERFAQEGEILGCVDFSSGSVRRIREPGAWDGISVADTGMADSSRQS